MLHVVFEGAVRRMWGEVVYIYFEFIKIDKQLDQMGKVGEGPLELVTIAKEKGDCISQPN
jgi:hypothetical protein